MKEPIQHIGFAAICALFVVQAMAQPSTVRCARSADSLHTTMKGLVRAQNSDLIVLGEAYDPDYSDRFILLQRFDQQGNAVTGTLHQVSGGPGVDAVGLVELNNGNFLAAVNDFPYARILRFDTDGQLLDARAGSILSTFFRNLVRVNDSTILGLGKADGDMMITWFDATGDPIASQKVSIDGNGGDAWYAIPAISGGYWVCGHGYDEEDLVASPNFRTCLLRYDATGQLLWAKRYIAPGLVVYPRGLVELPSGNLLIAGGAWRVNENTRPYLMKVGPEGDPLSMTLFRGSTDTTKYLYTSAIGGPYGSDIYLTAWGDEASMLSIRADTSGVGVSAGSDPSIHAADVAPIQWTEGLIFGVSSTDVPAYASNGLVESELPFGTPCGEPHPIFMDTLTLTVGEGFVETPVVLGLDDVTDQFTQVPYAVTLFDPCVSMSVSVEADAAADPQLWPVPAHDRIHVRGDHIQGVELLDDLGRVVAVASSSLASGIDLGWAAPGLYHLRVLQRGRCSVIPFIKE